MVGNNSIKRQPTTVRMDEFELDSFADRNGNNGVDIAPAGANIAYNYVVLAGR